MSGVRKDCWWHLKHGSAHLCKKRAVMSPPAPFVSLDLGCPPDCPDYDPTKWGIPVPRDAAADPVKPLDPAPSHQLDELEWDDDEESTNEGGRDR